jgi:hypothetical protein
MVDLKADHPPSGRFVLIRSCQHRVDRPVMNCAVARIIAAKSLPLHFSHVRRRDPDIPGRGHRRMTIFAN